MFTSKPNKSGLNHIVYYEDENIQVPVGEINFTRQGWEIHHTVSTHMLKDHAMEARAKWMKERITILELTRKMLK